MMAKTTDLFAYTSRGPESETVAEQKRGVHLPATAKAKLVKPVLCERKKVLSDAT